MDVIPSLPAELFHPIWEHLRTDGSPRGHSSLANCSLVCQEWRIPTQKALFSRTQLKLCPQDCARRLQLLHSSPHLQPMIINLSATLNLGIGIQAIEPLASILGVLTNVQTLELRGQPDGPNEFFFSWAEHDFITARLTKNLLHLVSQPCFRTLVLGNFTFLFEMDNWAFQRLLSNARSLKSLHIRGGGILKAGESSLPQPDPPIEPIRLEVLSLVVGRFTWCKDRLDGTKWAAFLHPFDFSALKELTIDHEQPHFCELPKAIPTLEKLTIISRLPDSQTTHIVDLAEVSSRLQYITFKVHTNQPVRQMPQWVEDSLRALPPTNAVQSLSFTIFAISPKALFAEDFLFPEEFFQNWDRNLFISRWEEIGNIIGPNNLPSLCRVKISTFGSHNGTDSEGMKISWLDVSRQAEVGLRRAHARELPFEIQTFGEEIQHSVDSYLYL